MGDFRGFAFNFATKVTTKVITRAQSLQEMLKGEDDEREINWFARTQASSPSDSTRERLLLSLLLPLDEDF